MASLSKDPTIRIYNKKKKYNEWQFIYNPIMDQANVLLRGPYQPITIGGAQIGTPAGQMNGQQQQAPSDSSRMDLASNRIILVNSRTVSVNSRVDLGNNPMPRNSPAAATSRNSRIRNSKKAISRQLSVFTARTIADFD